jgi:hypothetical protein
MQLTYSVGEAAFFIIIILPNLTVPAPGEDEQ